jgi:hypothetical protein
MKFLWSEKRDPVEIHYRLLRAFREDAYLISSVREWIRAFKTAHTIVLDELRAGRPRLDHIDSVILPLLTEESFHSVPTLAQELGVSLILVYDILVNGLGFSLRHAWWAYHLLTEELEAKGIATSIQVLRILQTQEPMGSAGIVTTNESWFFLERSQNHVWRLGDENASERVS